MEWLTDPTIWVGLLTLILLEIVLGIDNLIFIAILADKLPPEQRDRARIIGLSLALLMRLGLLASITWVMSLTAPLFSFWRLEISWRDLILIAGGLFLVWKATKEIHHHVDPDHGPDVFVRGAAAVSFGAVIGQILVLDMVFSVDSIITAVGMTDHVPIMIIAVVVTVAIMMVAATPLANFIHNNPSLVMLALGFLLLIGTSLVADAFGAHVPKGYIYSAMAFSVLVELLNMRSRRAQQRKRAAAAAAAAAGSAPAGH